MFFTFYFHIYRRTRSILRASEPRLFTIPQEGNLLYHPLPRSFINYVSYVRICKYNKVCLLCLKLCCILFDLHPHRRGNIGVLVSKACLGRPDCQNRGANRRKMSGPAVRTSSKTGNIHVKSNRVSHGSSTLFSDPHHVPALLYTHTYPALRSAHETSRTWASTLRCAAPSWAVPWVLAVTFRSLSHRPNDPGLCVASLERNARIKTDHSHRGGFLVCTNHVLNVSKCHSRACSPNSFEQPLIMAHLGSLVTSKSSDRHLSRHDQFNVDSPCNRTRSLMPLLLGGRTQPCGSSAGPAFGARQFMTAGHATFHTAKPP